MAELLNIINDLSKEFQWSDGLINWIMSLERNVIKDRRESKETETFLE